MHLGPISDEHHKVQWRLVYYEKISNARINGAISLNLDEIPEN